MQIKLGYTPASTVLKTLSGEHRFALGQLLTMKVLIYYGGLLEQQGRVRPEMEHMYHTLVKAVELDPYNMDAYYFAQAAFTWDLGQVKAVIKMLKYGYQFRSWDWYMPFFLGFNYAYFLKDKKEAAHYMQQAARLSGSELQTTLASRYFYEADQTDVGIMFLRQMLAGAVTESEKAIYTLRLKALIAVSELEQAVADYSASRGSFPDSLNLLVETKFLEKIPTDPYGGCFYINDKGKIHSTSNFSSIFMSKQNEH
ncbi:MAG: hypothetical protein PHH87_03990 [Desulfuromonas sp.]|nr:hypothetical protein [Desulfuromonas sp.]